MFTGLVETKEAVSSVTKTGNGIKLSVTQKADFDLQLGESVSVNGVCLTVIKQNGEISFDVSPETLKSTNIGELKVGDKVNLERALKLSDRLGGHLVTGHVDGTGIIRGKKLSGEYTFYTFDSSEEILKYVVQKGSIAVDGISLTVVGLDNRSFSVAIIPHTLTATNIGDKGMGDRVNLEVDIIGKYVEKFVAGKESVSGLANMLKEKGFVNE